jgi:GT2 family glycosyltransferase
MSLNKIDVTIIIVTFNSSQIIENCIKSIIDKTYNLNYQIVVVDNKSNDNTIEIIQNNFSDIKIIQNKENLGFGKANNQAILLFESKYYFLLNPDTELINNSITILYEFMEKKY